MNLMNLLNIIEFSFSNFNIANLVRNCFFHLFFFLIFKILLSNNVNLKYKGNSTSLQIFLMLELQVLPVSMFPL